MWPNFDNFAIISNKGMDVVFYTSFVPMFQNAVLSNEITTTFYPLPFGFLYNKRKCADW